mmetsp:Transcript_30710/g.95468  ORF Transcript_30710/g.95468 Transcript_30710/m.95468 type:complete len:428 (+) Transcript_30710:300-1583(+)
MHACKRAGEQASKQANKQACNGQGSTIHKARSGLRHLAASGLVYVYVELVGLLVAPQAVDPAHASHGVLPHLLDLGKRLVCCRQPLACGNLIHHELVDDADGVANAVLSHRRLPQLARLLGERGVRGAPLQGLDEIRHLQLAELLEPDADSVLVEDPGVEELVQEHGRDDARRAGADPASKGAGAPVVHEDRALGEENLVRGRLQEQDVLLGVLHQRLRVRLTCELVDAQLSPTPQHDATHASLLQSPDGEARHVLRGDRDHGAPAHVHGRRAAPEELLQRGPLAATEEDIVGLVQPLLLHLRGESPEARAREPLPDVLGPIVMNGEQSRAEASEHGRDGMEHSEQQFPDRFRIERLALGQLLHQLLALRALHRIQVHAKEEEAQREVGSPRGLLKNRDLLPAREAHRQVHGYAGHHIGAADKADFK